jgi:Na+/H+ antiporter NhaD/arsenite permease-like protein
MEWTLANGCLISTQGTGVGARVECERAMAQGDRPVKGEAVTMISSRWSYLVFAAFIGFAIVTSIALAGQDDEIKPAAVESVAPEQTPEKAPESEKAADEPAHDAKNSKAHADDGHDHDGHADDGHGGAGGGHGGHANIGKDLHLLAIAPFAALLLAIAVFPLTFAHWWEHNENKGIVAGFLSAIVIGYLAFYFGEAGVQTLIHAAMEYVSFVLLLGALYIISGGIYIRGSLAGTTLSNAILMLIGAFLASIIGTTGASVVLIRPLLRANKTRVAKAHIVVFFIFIVSNCGGLLTPLGDPPLFMGFTKGVPFEWTAINLWKEWFFINAALVLVYVFYDMVIFDREEKARAGSQLEEVMKHEPIGIDGMLNIVFLLGVVGAILAHGHFKLPFGALEGMLAVLALLAYITTSPSNRERNNFSFGPIIEVAVLFAGIFITMAPAIQILNAWGKGDRLIAGLAFGLSQPWQYFWATGILSSFLDNAPTYLTLAATACGSKGIGTDSPTYLLELLQQEPTRVSNTLLAAISCGAVFMGANTYIGNGPNFMVKAIAEENGVKMPSFFGYMVYSGAILIPMFIAMTFIFFRG